MTPRQPLRVCHVAYSFYENDNRVMRYAETLAARGDHVDVISLRQPGQAWRGKCKGVNIYRIQRRAVDERAAWVYLMKIVCFLVSSFVVTSVLGLRQAYDIVHVHNVPDFLVFAALTPKLRGAGIILDIHDVLPELYAGKFGTRKDSVLFRTLLLVERASCRFADHVIVANHLWQDKLTRRSLPSSKCTPFLNYPDLETFRPLPRQRPENGARFLFLYPGTLNHHQGLDIAISAFDQARPRMPDAEFHIYGDGPARDALVRQAKSLGLERQVRVMDRVPLGAVPELMALADAGVVPKRADGFGNEAFSTKILEFMACGVPVVVSRTMVDSYYFSDDIVKFFSPGDASDLARKMIWLYEHRGEHDAWVRSAMDFAERNGWRGHAPAYIELVDRFASSSPRPAGPVE